MKGKLIQRIMIAILLVSSFAIAPISSDYVNAEEQDKKEKEETKEVQEPGEPPSGENVIGKEEEVEIDIDTPASVTGEKMEGNGTVVDFTTNGSKAFYTIVDNEQQVFYLIIDMDKTDNNVYFLSEINRSELSGGDATANQNNVAPTPPAGVEQPEQEVQSETGTSDNNMGFLLTVIIIGLVGAVAYYFLVVKKKQNKNATSEDDEDEMTEDYEDDFEEDYYEEEENVTETENSQDK